MLKNITKASIVISDILMLYFRRRSQRKSKQLPEEKKVEKEEPVREYKVRDLVINIQIYIFIELFF